MNNRPHAISKVLSKNDTGETGGHQAGILIPKSGDVLKFFPNLGRSEKNPRVAMYFKDESGTVWKLHFIYYNNKFFDSHGTRDEYRLTGLTAYFKQNGLKSGDTIFLVQGDDDADFIKYKRSSESAINSEPDNGDTKPHIVIGDHWKVIDY